MFKRSALLVLAALAAGLIAAGPAAGPTSAPATASAPVKVSQGWLLSVPQASKEAKASGRLIMADFTGSDWCPWCKRLKAEVFDTKEFKDWAAKNVILLELDYPRAKQDPALKLQNAGMLAKFKSTIKGYPTILFLTADGEKVGQTGYIEGGPTAWIPNAQGLIDAAKKSQK